MIKRLAGAMVCAILATVFLSPVQALAAYPERTIKFVVPVAPGGSIDTVARIVADYLRIHLSRDRRCRKPTRCEHANRRAVCFARGA